VISHIMEEDEFLKVVDNISKVVQIMYSQKRMADNQGIAPFKIFITFVSMMLFVAFLIVEYIAVLKEELQLEYTGYSLFGFGFIMMGSLTAYESIRDSHNIVFHFDDKVKAALQKHLEMISEVHIYRGI
jgi:hypothetical protein